MCYYPKASISQSCMWSHRYKPDEQRSTHEKSVKEEGARPEVGDLNRVLQVIRRQLLLIGHIQGNRHQPHKLVRDMSATPPMTLSCTFENICVLVPCLPSRLSLGNSLVHVFHVFCCRNVQSMGPLLFLVFRLLDKCTEYMEEIGPAIHPGQSFLNCSAILC
jgi:hypothetical protein